MSNDEANIDYAKELKELRQYLHLDPPDGVEPPPPPFKMPEIHIDRSFKPLLPFGPPQLPEFPTHVLPPLLQRWVKGESRITQTPPDLSAMLVLATCAAAAARNVKILTPLGRDSVNLFVAVPLESGERKGIVYQDALMPLREYQAEFLRSSRDGVARVRSGVRFMRSRLRALERKAVPEEAVKEQRAACDYAAELAVCRDPYMPWLLTDEAAGNKLLTMIADNDRIASFTSDGGVFDMMAARRGLNHLHVYVKAHAGLDMYSEHLSRFGFAIYEPALTCACSSHPAILKGLAKSPTFRGRGVISRFLYAMPTSRVGRREIVREQMISEIRLEYRELIRRLAQRESTLQMLPEPDADKLLQAWEQEIETMLADGGPLASVRDWGNELARHTLRIAAVLQVVEQETERIGVPAMQAAIEIARYLVPHANAAIHLMEAGDSTSETDARFLLDWILRTKRTNFSRREAHQASRRRFRLVEDIYPAIIELIRRGYIRDSSEFRPKPGRPPSPDFTVNLLLYGFSSSVDPKMSSESFESAGSFESASSQSAPAASPVAPPSAGNARESSFESAVAQSAPARPSFESAGRENRNVRDAEPSFGPPPVNVMSDEEFAVIRERLSQALRAVA